MTNPFKNLFKKPEATYAGLSATEWENGLWGLAFLATGLQIGTRVTQHATFIMQKDGWLSQIGAAGDSATLARLLEHEAGNVAFMRALVDNLDSELLDALPVGRELKKYWQPMLTALPELATKIGAPPCATSQAEIQKWQQQQQQQQPTACAPSPPRL